MKHRTRSKLVYVKIFVIIEGLCIDKTAFSSFKDQNPKQEVSNPNSTPLNSKRIISLFQLRCLAMFKRKHNTERHGSSPLQCSGDRTVVKGFPWSMNAELSVRPQGTEGKQGEIVILKV